VVLFDATTALSVCANTSLLIIFIGLQVRPVTGEMYSVFALISFFFFVTAIRDNRHREIESYQLAKPILNVTFPVPRGPRSLFRRQGCENLDIACPNNICCPVDTACCGALCCDINTSLCWEDNVGAQCCLPYSDTTGICGDGGINSNVRSTSSLKSSVLPQR
jgi:hypothetical protein